jgi:hypothetical protein
MANLMRINSSASVASGGSPTSPKNQTCEDEGFRIDGIDGSQIKPVKVKSQLSPNDPDEKDDCRAQSPKANEDVMVKSETVKSEVSNMAQVQKETFIKELGLLKQWFSLSNIPNLKDKWIGIALKQKLESARLRLTSTSGLDAKEGSKSDAEADLKETFGVAATLLSDILSSGVADASAVDTKARSDMVKLFAKPDTKLQEGKLFDWTQPPKLAGLDLDMHSGGILTQQMSEDAVERVVTEYAKMGNHDVFKRMDRALASSIMGAYHEEIVKRATIQDSSQIQITGQAQHEEAVMLAQLLTGASIEPLMAPRSLDKDLQKVLELNSRKSVKPPRDFRLGVEPLLEYSEDIDLDECSDEDSDDFLDSIFPGVSLPPRQSPCPTPSQPFLKPPISRASTAPTQPSTEVFVTRLASDDAKSQKASLPSISVPPRLKRKKIGEEPERWRKYKPKEADGAEVAVSEALAELSSSRKVAGEVQAKPSVKEWLQKCGQVAQTSTQWLNTLRPGASHRQRSQSPIVKPSDIARLPGLQACLFETGSSVVQPKPQGASQVVRSQPPEINDDLPRVHAEASTTLVSGQLCGGPSTRVQALGQQLSLGPESQSPGRVLKVKPNLPQKFNVPLASCPGTSHERFTRPQGSLETSTHSNVVLRMPAKPVAQRRRKHLYEPSASGID